MRTDLFDFDLPAASIALRPAYPRDCARMLVVPYEGSLSDRVVADLPALLAPGDQLVVNDTRVISAKLSGRRIGRDTEPRIEATLIKRLDGSRWQALVRPAKKLATGDVVRFGHEGRVCLLGHLDARVDGKGSEGEVTLAFSFHGPALDQAIAELGSPPLPPYIASKRRRLPDHVRDARGRGRRPDRGTALHTRSGSALTRTRHRHSADHAACRGRDLPAS
jgi:S-adenosylmethionine:tRNA ribosyltransferase-isomerase